MIAGARSGAVARMRKPLAISSGRFARLVLLVAIPSAAAAQSGPIPEEIEPAPSGSYWQAGGVCLEHFLSPAAV